MQFANARSVGRNALQNVHDADPDIIVEENVNSKIGQLIWWSVKLSKLVFLDMIGAVMTSSPIIAWIIAGGNRVNPE